jgi:putative sigma-54 modulation protein
MRIEIISKNYRSDEGLKTLLTKKLARLDKYFQQEGSAAVKLTAIGDDRFQMEIVLDIGGGKYIRAASSAAKMNKNIDEIMPKIERQIVKNRTKIDNKLKKDANVIPPEYIKAGEDKAPKAKVVKEKHFDISVCTAENAVEEMELLGHDFYVFINGQTNRVNVVYKRTDGDFGLIDPLY